MIDPRTARQLEAARRPILQTRVRAVYDQLLFQPTVSLHRSETSNWLVAGRHEPVRRRKAAIARQCPVRHLTGGSYCSIVQLTQPGPRRAQYHSLKTLQGAVSGERKRPSETGEQGTHPRRDSAPNRGSPDTGPGTSTETISKTRESVSSEAVERLSSSEPETTSFMEWARQAGIEIDGLCLEYFGRERLRGLVASETLPARSILARIPGYLALQTRSDDGARGCPLPPAVCAPDFWKGAPWWGRLALLLLYERYKSHPESAQELETRVLRRQLRRWERRPNQRRGPARVTESAMTLVPWLQLLPTSFEERPLHWTPAERRQLQYPCLERAIIEQERKWRDLYARFTKQTFMERGIALESLGGLFSEHDFVWALDIVVTRAFSGPCETTPFGERWRQTCFAGALSLASWNTHLLDAAAALNVFLVVAMAQLVFDVLYPRIYRSLHGSPLKKYVIAPLIDLFNHSSRVTSTVSYEYFYDAFLLSVLDRTYSTGEQVFISYGKLTNDELLAVYGFVEDDNPHDTYKLWEPRSETMIILDAAGAVRNPEMLPALSDVALAALIRDELGSKPTTLAQDQELRPESRRIELARRFRIAKKRILERALGRLEGVDEPHSKEAG
jgi:hypothetical protein